MLFPNSRGNKAETNLRPLESRLAIESRLANYDSEFHLAISSSILAYLGEENFESCDVMCIVWSFFCLPRNVASNAKLLKLGEFLNVHQMPELNTVSLSEPCCAEYFIAMHIALDQDVSLIRSGEAGTCSQGILLIVFFSGFLESSTSFLDSTRCRL